VLHSGQASYEGPPVRWAMRIAVGAARNRTDRPSQALKTLRPSSKAEAVAHVNLGAQAPNSFVENSPAY